MADEQEWSGFADQAYVATSDTFLARTTAGAGVEVAASHVVGRRTSGGPFRAEGSLHVDAAIGVGAPPSGNGLIEAIGTGNAIIRIKGGAATNQGAAYFITNANNSITFMAMGDRARIFGGTPDAAASLYTGATPLHFDVGGAPRAIITTTGFVGIGTASPASALHVSNGAIRVGGSESSVSMFFANGLRHTGSGSFNFDINSGGAAGGMAIRDGSGFTTRLMLEAGGNIRPGGDNSQSIGTASFRWSTVFAGTGAINTSDERAKDDISDIPDAWLDAWGDVAWQRFRFKGGRRWHVGLISQRVHAAFEKHGLDAFDIGLCCFDEWDAEMRDILDDDGEPTGKQEEIATAGDRWGLRYDECFAMEAAWMRREMQKIAGKI